MQDRQKTSSYLFLLSCTLNRRFDSFTLSKNVSVYFGNDGKTELQHDLISSELTKTEITQQNKLIINTS